MSNIDKRALRHSAESIIGILENIAGFEPSDIDGDSVELRFETEDGFDTGCDVSIVDQCQKTADVVRALLDERERNQQYIKRRDQENEDIALTVGKLRVELEAANERIAELEALKTPRLTHTAVNECTISVSAEAIRACMEEFPESVQDIVEECASIAENACRAAMIQGANPVQGWIPCSDRMPEFYFPVLVTDEHEDMAIALPVYLDAGGRCSFQLSNGDIFIATHWMPLPAAPQQEADNG